MVWRRKYGRVESAEALRKEHAIESGWVQINQGLGQFPGQSYGGYKQSCIGREFSLEGMRDSYTQGKNITVNLSRLTSLLRVQLRLNRGDELLPRLA